MISQMICLLANQHALGFCQSCSASATGSLQTNPSPSATRIISRCRRADGAPRTRSCSDGPSAFVENLRTSWPTPDRPTPPQKGISSSIKPVSSGSGRALLTGFPFWTVQVLGLDGLLAATAGAGLVAERSAVSRSLLSMNCRSVA